MATATGRLEIVEQTGVKVIEWNGHQPDRDLARTAFSTAVRGGGLAVLYETKEKGRVVRSFTEVEQAEKEQGTVTVRVSRALAGG